MNRLKAGVVTALAALLLTLPVAAAAENDCRKQMELIGKRIVEVQKKIDALPAKDRRLAQAFLDDGKKVLEQAHQTCLNATDDVDRALALARGAVARGNAEAADMMATLKE